VGEDARVLVAEMKGSNLALIAAVLVAADHWWDRWNNVPSGMLVSGFIGILVFLTLCVCLSVEWSRK